MVIKRTLIIGSIIAGLLIFVFGTPGLVLDQRGLLLRVTSCGIPEGCGSEYKLESTGIDFMQPKHDLTGALKPEDDGKIVAITGIKIPLPSSTPGRTIYGVKVLFYRTLSAYSTGELTEESQNYMAKKYGCLCTGPERCDFKYKFYSWNYASSPIFLAQYTIGGTEVTLTYDGNTGKMTQRVIPPDSISCPTR